ncbi:hypothetical protein FQA39_LY07196 [Lamprigera yunnana]|nr:hypothetical protein FQA39_LY07196 [Lamprigera yunnana]
MRKYKFQTEWLRKLDITGKVVESWGRKFNNDKIFCIICSKAFSIVAGFAKINQHALSSAHKNAANEKLDNNQLKLAPTSPTPTDGMVNQKHTLQLYSNREAITKLELLWCMKIVTSNWSFNSCSDLSEFIKNIHPEIPTGFSLSTSKIRNIYYNKPELVIITKAAEEEHNKHLEDTVKELEAKKKELEDAEKNLTLQALKKEGAEIMKTLLKVANKKLSTAIKAKEATSNVSVAKVLLETAIKSHEKEQESEKKIVELQ